MNRSRNGRWRHEYDRAEVHDRRCRPELGCHRVAVYRGVTGVVMTFTERALRAGDDRHNRWWYSIIAAVLIFGALDAAKAWGALLARQEIGAACEAGSDEGPMPGQSEPGTAAVFRRHQ